MNINKITKFSKESVDYNSDNFDFELWAQLVKPQLIAALEKSNEKRKKAHKS
ncbi:hypothetical protein IQ238_22375 [Pleurocapsales cyanobacterium LEGE 06147]|nr:hypothetical protein [Pleurocapsales cyanobacterium LEGE 06147]